MSTPKWHEGTLVAFDTETTGTDPRTERIVTASIVYLTPGKRPRPMSWVIDPGVPIPDKAAAVHGWTTDRVAAIVQQPGWAVRTSLSSTGRTVTSPMPADVAVHEITTQVAAAIGREEAVVIHNAAYDLTLLECENVRYGVDTLASRPWGVVGVVDPMVVEKQYDPRRSTKKAGGCTGGKHRCGGCGAVDRKLSSLCLHYGLAHGGAHDASADAVAAGRLARRLVGLWPEVARWKLPTLFEKQVGWRREQADGLRAHFDRNGVEHDGVDGGWPLHTALAARPGSTSAVGASAVGASAREAVGV